MPLDKGDYQNGVIGQGNSVQCCSLKGGYPSINRHLLYSCGSYIERRARSLSLRVAVIT